MSHDHDEDDHSEIEGLSMKDFEKQFSHLAEELKTGSPSVSDIMPEDTTVKTDDSSKSEKPVFSNYDPGVMDFLARASTVKESEEIIAYCLKKGEITKKQEEDLLFQLHTLGPSVFGSREPDYYEKQKKLK